VPLDRVAHGEERVGVADDPLDVAAGGLLEQRDRELEGGGRIIGVRSQ
jgi:hypothetical protein